MTMADELRELNARPDPLAFCEAPGWLRPHWLGGNPKRDAAEAMRFIEDVAASKAQCGITLQPDWKRWDDPALFSYDDPYWRHGRVTLETLRQRGGFAWIYDEPGFPSGSAGILTLKDNPELIQSGVVCEYVEVAAGESAAIDVPQGRFLGAWFVCEGVCPVIKEPVPAEDGKAAISTVAAGKLCAFSHAPYHLGSITHIYRKEHVVNRFHSCVGDPAMDVDDPLYSYPNLMDIRATTRFIDVAYEPYMKHWGGYMGSTVRAFFTDEPTIPFRHYAPGQFPATIPWCDGFERQFSDRFGYNILEYLPELFFGFGGAEARSRCDYYDLVADLFALNFCRTITDWCGERGMFFTGHMLHEEHLATQLLCNGSLMRSLREMSMPGMDNLSMGFPERSVGPLPSITGLASECGAVTPKMVSSAAHLGGWARTISESHGWSSAEVGTTFSDYVATANWSAVLGVNTLPYYCMDWKDADDAQKAQMSRYASRLSYMTTGGVHRADVAVLHPITGVWAAFTPLDARISNRNRMDAFGRESWQYWTDGRIDRIQSVFDDTARLLLAHQRDFDYVEDGDIECAAVLDGKLCIGDERFGAVLLPSVPITSIGCLRRLDEFLQGGGVVVAAGCLPELMRKPEDQPEADHIMKRWKEHGVLCFGDPQEAVRELDARLNRDVSFDLASPDIYVLHRVKDSVDIYMLANNAVEEYRGSCLFSSDGPACLWNAWNGKVYALDGVAEAGGTRVNLTIPGRTACFVVFNGPTGGPADQDMWHFGPVPMGPAERAAFDDVRMREHYLGSREPALSKVPLGRWELFCPDGGITMSEDGECNALMIEPWRRLGWAIEGMDAHASLIPGLYLIEAEVNASNVNFWSLLPRHYGDGKEVVDPGTDGLQWRQCLNVLSEHGWIRQRLWFRVPEGAESTRITFFPCCKRLFSREASLSVRDTTLYRVIQ